MGQVDEADLPGQHDRRKDVLDALGHRDDVALDDLVAVSVHDRPEGAEQCQGAGVVRGAGRGQRPPALQLGGQQGRPLGRRGAGVVDVVGGEQGGQGVVVLVRMLANVHRGDVEADHLQDPTEPGHATVGQ